MLIAESINLAKAANGGVNWSAAGWVAGSLSLGCVVARLVRHSLTITKKVKLKAVVSVLMGGVVLKFLTFFSFSLWAYCIGLLIGIVGYPLIEGRRISPQR